MIPVIGCLPFRNYFYYLPFIRTEMTYTKKFSEINKEDLAQVGGKNSSLGEMYTRLASRGVRVPDGFATTAKAFWAYLDENRLRVPLQKLIKGLDRKQFSNLSATGKAARELIHSGSFSPAFERAIREAYRELCGDAVVSVAVRSSATAEDLPHASFAGQHESYLNIRGETALLQAVKACFASLYTDRAIKYREDKGFRHGDIALSVGVQHMVRADSGCSGVLFTIEPESGFEKVMLLSGVWGLGENIVQGVVTPDEYYLFKTALDKGKYPILQKRLGGKQKTMVYAAASSGMATKNINTPGHKRRQYVLSDTEATQLARWGQIIENHYGKPMDIEWAKDGKTGELYIIQARPETVHRQGGKRVLVTYHLKQTGKTLASGSAVGSKICTGIARVLHSPAEGVKLDPSSIIVTANITPDWDPLLKQVKGIVTDKGGRTSHAAIVARELGVPAVVGCGNATTTIREGEMITISCAQGKTGEIFEGALPFETREIDFSNIRKPRTEIKMILADPENAFQLANYPNDGVGLLRMEFIITHWVKVHPMALVHFEKVRPVAERKAIAALTEGYPDRNTYFVEMLSQGIATIAAAFYPKEVIVRLSDFKTNEYANLIGGKDFEPMDENPMLVFRGASRYYSELYSEGFALECAAIKRVRETMGLDNLKVMVPFCRTPEEGRKVMGIMEKNGLKRGVDGLEVYTMVEIPSNVILAEEFARVFDGFSIGSNDLTQLTLGIDRDSELMGSLFDENDAAARKMISIAIKKARKTGTKIGFCGQAPSDFPEYASFLVQEGINSISFNPDALLQGMENTYKAEQAQAKIRLHDTI